MKNLVFSVIVLSMISMSASAQSASENDTTPFYMMSLEELMNLNVTVASQVPMINRESPGIITIITSEEIKRTGFTDLMQVLQTVPGFDFGVDVDGVVGIGFRGNWSHEGKVLMLLDGMEMNEDLYSNIPMGHHFPVDRIKRIEIIRGPGSAMYGSYAEFAVINIITFNDNEFNGLFASATQSFLKKSLNERAVSLAWGKSIGQAHINLSSSLTDAKRSDQIYTDGRGNSYDMTDQSHIGNSEYRLDFQLKGLSLTGRYNSYELEQRDGYEQISKRPYVLNFNMGNINVKYDLRTKRGLMITPGIKLKFQKPWNYSKEVVDDNFLTFNTSINKKEYYTSFSYDPSYNVNLVAGVQYYNQLAKQNLDSVNFFNGKQVFNNDNYSAFLQALIKLSACNIILGNRYEYNPYYGSSYAPRVGVTRIWNKYHLKALYSKAFRNPSFENINLNPNIKPETAHIFEVEGGCMINDHSYLTANVYYIHCHNSILYSYENSQSETYKNEDGLGTSGFELEYKWKSKILYASVNYSYYLANDDMGHYCIYDNPATPNQFLAFPRHRANLNANIILNKHINLNPTISFYSSRDSYSANNSGVITMTKYSPSLYSNLAINFEDIFKKALSFKIACLNISDEKIIYIQPYQGNHEPLPGTGRELLLKATYSF